MSSLVNVIRDLEKQSKGNAFSDGLGHSALTGKVTQLDRQGHVVGTIGEQPDGSYAQVAWAGPDPLQPTTPVVEGKALAVAVTWDGNLHDPTTGLVDAELDAYADTLSVEVHLATALPAPLGGFVGEFVTAKGGTISVPSPAGDVFVSLRVKSKAGKVGPFSDWAPVTVDPLVDTAQFEQMALDLALAGDTLEAAVDDLDALATADVDVARLVVGELGARQAVIEELSVRIASIIELSVERLFVPGGATISTLVAQSIAAEIAQFVQLSADQITAGDIEALLNISAGGEVRVGDLSQVHVRIRNGAIEVWLPGAIEGEDEFGNPVMGEPTLVTSLGGSGGDVFLIYDKATRELLGGIRADGSVFTPVLDVGEIILDGTNINDRFDDAQNRFIHYSDFSDVQPKRYTKFGVFAWGFHVKAGQGYRTTIRARIQHDGSYASCGLNASWGSTKNGTSAPTINSAQVEDTHYHTNEGVFASQTIIRDYFATADGYVRMLFWIEPVDSTRYTRSRSHYFTTELMGVVPSISGQASTGGATGEPPPPPTPPVEDFQASYGFEDHQVWSQHGKVTDPRYDPSYVRHGTGGSSHYRTMLPFSSAMKSRIAGASSISKVELYLGAAKGYSNVDLWIGAIRVNSYAGSTEPTIYDGHNTNREFSPGETDWVTVGAAVLDEITSGRAQGLAVGRTSSSTLIDFHGPGHDSRFPRLRIKGKE